VWLAPEQVRILPITDDVRESAAALLAELKKAGIRATLDDRAETLGYRIRDAETEKIPFMAVIGAREAEGGTVAVRRRGAGKKQDVLAWPEFIAQVQQEVESRALS
jgi:threonyl-tRNA synthetase